MSKTGKSKESLGSGTPVKFEARIAALECAARWCQNILAEVSGNNTRILPPKAREHLKNAIGSLAEFMQALAEFQAEKAKVDSMEV